MQTRGIADYKRTQVETATPVQLLVMLYDAALDNCRRAKDAIAQNDLDGKSQAVDKSLAIIGELQGSLDMEQGGEIAKTSNACWTPLGPRGKKLRVDRRPPAALSAIPARRSAAKDRKPRG